MLRRDETFVATIDAPQTSMGPVRRVTTWMLAMPAETASVSRSRIIEGIQRR
jgi:hypothetical protein